MKAVILTEYGPPEFLQLVDIERPEPKDNQVLVKMKAAAINDWEVGLLKGKPLIIRMTSGWFKPKSITLGVDMAGTIEAVGARVTQFKVGDDVYCDLSDQEFGGFAEYVVAEEQSLGLKPGKMSFSEAAAIPHAAMLAVQGLIDIGKISRGEKVLINGAGGGVGAFGVQLAKLYGCEVTGVDHASKQDSMLAIGYDHVIDYEKEDFTRAEIKYDLILDAKTTRSASDYARVLNKNGRYVTVGGSMGRIFQILIMGMLYQRLTKKSLKVVGLKPNKDLAYINQLYEEGKIRTVLDGPYKLSQVPEAIQYFIDAKHKGKIIIIPD